jgi:polyvinyl alcohol dehydrogenase (cytochrome)
MSRSDLGVVRALALIVALILPVRAFAVPVPEPLPAGQSLYDLRCKNCHEPAQGRAPGREQLAQRSASDIFVSLKSGAMKAMSQGLSDTDMRDIASYLTAPGQSAQSGKSDSLSSLMMPAPSKPSTTDKLCPAGTTLKASASSWPLSGFDGASSRFQPHLGLTAQNVSRLKVKWSFAMEGGGQPVVLGGWVFATNRNGTFYALDGKTGCVLWSAADAQSRNTPLVLKNAASPSGWMVLIGQLDKRVRAFDAQDGKTLWYSPVLDDHVAASLTGAATASGDTLYVPVSSYEEAVSMSKTYACCTFRGSLVALDLRTGAQKWKTYTIDEAPSAYGRVNASGMALKGPAGGAIWSAPSVDPARGLVYAATGDSYTDIDTEGSDAIVAFDMVTGKIRWREQVTEGDNFVMGCNRKGPAATGNCPTELGPDHDFGASPILFTLPGGKQILLAGQKSGMAYGLSPDSGKQIWNTQVGVGGELGGIEWGMAADRAQLYVAMADLTGLFREAAGDKSLGLAKPGLSALDPKTGKIKWYTPSPAAPCGLKKTTYDLKGCMRAQSAAPSVIPGAIISGTTDGWLRAYEAKTGKIIWEYSSTAQTFATVNGVPAQVGGGFDGMGPAIADGMVFVMSGFNGASRIAGNGRNVLLAFSVDGQ